MEFFDFSPSWSTSRPCTYMNNSAIVNFSVFASIGVAYMHSDNATLDNAETRIMHFEAITMALVALLQYLGRPPYLASIFQLWTAITNSLVLFEQMVFPEQVPQTSTSLTLPPRAKPLSAIMNDDFQEHTNKLEPAVTCLRAFLHWYRQRYDTELHAETTSMLEDLKTPYWLYHTPG